MSYKQPNSKKQLRNRTRTVGSKKRYNNHDNYEDQMIYQQQQQPQQPYQQLNQRQYQSNQQQHKQPPTIDFRNQDLIDYMIKSSSDGTYHTPQPHPSMPAFYPRTASPQARSTTTSRSNSPSFQQQRASQPHSRSFVPTQQHEHTYARSGQIPHIRPHYTQQQQPNTHQQQVQSSVNKNHVHSSSVHTYASDIMDLPTDPYFHSHNYYTDRPSSSRISQTSRKTSEAHAGNQHFQYSQQHINTLRIEQHPISSSSPNTPHNLPQYRRRKKIQITSDTPNDTNNTHIINISINDTTTNTTINDNDDISVKKIRRHSQQPRTKKRRKESESSIRARHKSTSRSRKKRKETQPNIALTLTNQSSSASRSSSKKGQKSRLNTGKLAENYFIKDKLGKGNFAVVRRVIRKIDGQEFAAKIISKKHLSDQEVHELTNEVQVLSQCYHPNIVRLVDFIDTPRHLYIVLEILTGGELFDRIIARGKFTEHQAADITKQLADALAYLHRNGIVHRDLKPENILYEGKNINSRIKITDFGLSRDTTRNPNKALKTACGTPGYVAPEILKAQVYDEGVDLWSVGVIIYILLCGFPPFQGAGPDHTQQMFRKIKAGQYSFPSPAWDNISAVARDCIQGLLTVQPKERMSAEELQNHPWVVQAQRLEGQNLLNEKFSENLSNYLHKKRFRRGVRLVISLNRMIRAAGLEQLAREQRAAYRERLRLFKIKVKAQQRKLYDEQQAQGFGNKDRNKQWSFLDDFDPLITNPDETPAIDYNKI